MADWKPEDYDRMLDHFANVWRRRRLPNWRRLTAPTAVISLPINGFSTTVGVPVTLDPTNTTDPDDAWVGTWTVTGPGAVVRFTHTGTFGNFASHLTNWTPTVAEGVTVDWVVTDGSGQTSSAQVTGNVTPTGVPKIVLTTQPSSSAVNGVNFGQVPVFQLRDASNNNLAIAGVSIVVTSSAGTLAMSPQPIVTNGSGTASPSTIKITGTVGNYTITGGATGYTGATSNPISLTPGAVNAATSTATVPNATTGTNRTVTVQGKDASGNNVLVGGATVNVSVTGANAQSGNATDNGNGTYTKTLTSANAGTDTVTITLGGVGISGSPFTSVVGVFNEPGGEGLVRIFEDTMSDTPATDAFGSAPHPLAGWRGVSNFNSNLSLVSDSAAPISPTSCWRYRYPTGMSGGSGPGPIVEWWEINTSAPTDNQKSKFYFRIHLKMGDPSVGGGTTYENQSVGTKLFYWSSGQTNGQVNTNFLLFDGNGSTSILSGARILPYIKSWNDTTGEFSSAGEVAPNVATVSVGVGSWATVELFCVINSLPVSGPGTVKDGVFKMWVNGTLTHNLTNVEWRSGLHNWKFFRLHMDPVWGGSAGSKTRDDYWRFDHVYGSAAA